MERPVLFAHRIGRKAAREFAVPGIDNVAYHDRAMKFEQAALHNKDKPVAALLAV
jgi:hypothetical protein